MIKEDETKPRNPQRHPKRVLDVGNSRHLVPDEAGLIPVQERSKRGRRGNEFSLARQETLGFTIELEDEHGWVHVLERHTRERKVQSAHGDNAHFQVVILGPGSFPVTENPDHGCAGIAAPKKDRPAVIPAGRSFCAWRGEADVYLMVFGSGPRGSTELRGASYPPIISGETS